MGQALFFKSISQMLMPLKRFLEFIRNIQLTTAKGQMQSGLLIGLGQLECCYLQNYCINGLVKLVISQGDSDSHGRCIRFYEQKFNYHAKQKLAYNTLFSSRTRAHLYCRSTRIYLDELFSTSTITLILVSICFLKL